MKRFVFRLESVLKLRGFELDRARRALANALARLDARRRALAGEEQRQAEAIARLERRGREGLTAGLWGVGQAGLAAGRLRIEHARAACRAAEGPVDQARAHVREAHARRRALEILKVRAREAHDAETRREEQMELDEIGSQRDALRRREQRLAAVGAKGESLGEAT